jgi:predicted nucleotidyltransferase
MQAIVNETIAKYFRDKPIRRAYVFGSYARNEERPDSDVDILVDLEPNAGLSLFEFGRMLEDLKELLQRDVDLVSEDGLSRHIQPFIEQEKVLVYEK